MIALGNAMPAPPAWLTAGVGMGPGGCTVDRVVGRAGTWHTGPWQPQPLSSWLRCLNLPAKQTLHWLAVLSGSATAAVIV